MPIVKVGMLRGKSVQYKKIVLDCIHKGLVDSLRIEDWDRFQQVIEYDRNDFEYPSFKSDNFMIIELTLFPGRTKEQKAAAIETITGHLNSALGIDASDIFIIINEPPLENWGIGGKQKAT